MTIDVGGRLRSNPFAIDADIYATLLGDSLRFFYIQRSGVEIRDEVAPGYGRPAGHVGVAPNRGDTAVRAWAGPDAARMYPGWAFDKAVDVSGGWYDAGDHGKYVTSGGPSAAMLLSAYERKPEMASLLDEALWEMDWMLRMQVPPGEQYAGLAFHRVHDDHWTPLPLAPHVDEGLRVLHRPSTAAGLNLAAVAAFAARLSAVSQPVRAARFLTAARVAYDAALEQPALFAPNDRGAFGGGPYDHDEVTHEFYWAATELFLTTGDVRFEDDLVGSPCHTADVFDLDGFEANTMAAFARLQLAARYREIPEGHRIRRSVIDAAEGLLRIQRAEPWGQPYSPSDGWDWGSNGRILNNLIVIASVFDLTGDVRYRHGLLLGLDYLFGRNAVGMSFVTGYGSDFAHRQRVRHLGHALDPTFPPPAAGSVAGGPASKVFEGFPADPRFVGLPPQLCYVDEPTSETTRHLHPLERVARLDRCRVGLTATFPRHGTDGRLPHHRRYVPGLHGDPGGRYGPRGDRDPGVVGDGAAHP